MNETYPYLFLRYPRIFCEVSCNQTMNLGILSVDLNTPVAIQQLWIIGDACLQRYRPSRTETLRKTAGNGFFITSTYLHNSKTAKDKCSRYLLKTTSKVTGGLGRHYSHWLMIYSSNIHLHPASSDHKSIPPLWQRWRPQCPAGHMEQSLSVQCLNYSLTVPADSSEREKPILFFNTSTHSASAY